MASIRQDFQNLQFGYANFLPVKHIDVVFRLLSLWVN